MIILPTFQSQSARFSYDIELNGEIFHLKFSWNSREESWYMDIQDQNEVNILTGIKLVINYFLLEQYKAYENLPKGDFKLWDIQLDPTTGGLTFDNFGRRYQLFFLTDDELDTGVLDLSGLQ